MVWSSALLLAALTYRQVASHPALPVSQPKINDNTINALLAQQYLPPNNELVFQDDELTNGINLTVKFPGIDVFLAKKSFNDRSRDVLTQTLPSTLQQFGIPADQIRAKVDQGIPLLIDSIKELMFEEEGLVARRLARRDGGLLDWAGQAACGLVAAAGVGPFLIAALDFAAGNSGGKLLSKSRTQKSCFENVNGVDVLQVSRPHRSRISSSFLFTATWRMMNRSRFSIMPTRILLLEVLLAQPSCVTFISRAIQSPHFPRLSPLVLNESLSF